jgi:hypothetical protein
LRRPPSVQPKRDGRSSRSLPLLGSEQIGSEAVWIAAAITGGEVCPRPGVDGDFETAEVTVGTVGITCNILSPVLPPLRKPARKRVWQRLNRRHLHQSQKQRPATTTPLIGK